MDSSRLSLPPRGRRTLLGCSGGADSTALAWLLHEAGHRRVVLCHLHHGLRGAAATRDQKFVRDLAERLGFGFRTERMDVATLAREQRISVELAARNARLDFFMRCARSERSRCLLLAHQADDQVETVLHHFLRGSGLRGLGGMKSVSEWTHGGRVLEIRRPLLEWTREDLRDYLRSHRRKWREDASNTSLEPTRNRLRLDLIPYIQSLLGREIRGPLLRMAAIVRDEDAWMDSLLPPLASRLSVATLRDLPPPLQRRQLLRWLNCETAGGSEGAERPMNGWREVESARKLLEPGGPAKINLPGDRHLRRRAGELFIEEVQ